MRKVKYTKSLSRDKTAVLYGGFHAGKLVYVTMDDFFGDKNLRPCPALFLTRAEAMAQFTDVRKIELRIVEPQLTKRRSDG